MKSPVLVSVIGGGVGTLAISWLCYSIWRRRKLQHPDASKWQKLGHLAEIHYYPMRSCASVTLDQVICKELGLYTHGMRDRCLVAIDQNDKFASASVYPQMLSIKPELVGDRVVCLTAPHMEPLMLDLNEILQAAMVREVKRKGYRLPVVECKEEHHKWFSKAILGRESDWRMHIVLEPLIEQSWWRRIVPEFYPLMVLHRKSVQDLNKRLTNGTQAQEEQFRGNLVIDSVTEIPPYDEDKWLFLRIGNELNDPVILRYNSDCVRCIRINLDVNTCARNENFEPLKTLKKYRMNQHPTDPSMGSYFDVLKSGVLKQGDTVYVQYK